MTTPNERYRQYTALYRHFTEAYTNVNSLTRDFYPQARQFVENTEPELNSFVEKTSGGYEDEGASYARQKLMNYLRLFDDFTISANQLFTDLKATLEKSERLMTRLITLKKNHITDTGETPEEIVKDVMPELNLLLEELNQIPVRATNLETKMKKLQKDWTITREKIA